MRPAAVIVSFAVITLAAACGSKSDAPPPPLTKAQRRTVDSTIGESRLPGAKGVKGALAMSDSAAAKRKLEDSISNNP